MVILHPLEVSEAEFVMEHGEFSKKIVTSGENVVVILTQGWCPQWMALKRQITKLEVSGLTAYIFIYDKSPIFTEFMRFKEQTFRNYEVPYIRYYHDGKLITTSNAVGKRRFLQNLEH